MKQTSFLDQPPKYQAHSQTSKAAAAAIERGAETLRGAVYRLIYYRGPLGMTDEEIQRKLDMNPSTQRPRRVELVEKRLVRDSGLTRKTKSGRQATVWVKV